MNFEEFEASNEGGMMYLAFAQYLGFAYKRLSKDTL